MVPIQQTGTLGAVRRSRELLWQRADPAHARLPDMRSAFAGFQAKVLDDRPRTESAAHPSRCRNDGIP